MSMVSKTSGAPLTNGEGPGTQYVRGNRFQLNGYVPGYPSKVYNNTVRDDVNNNLGTKIMHNNNNICAFAYTC